MQRFQKGGRIAHTIHQENVYSKGVERDVESLEKAMTIMKKKDCADPLSWYYQSAMHWVPDTISGKNARCDSYQDNTQLKTAWDNCTHSETPSQEIHFLLWHRLYIYHFEKIVRKLSGNPDFALPYWGYTNVQDSILNRTLPEIFRKKQGSLFEAGRVDSLNKGLPISGKTVRRLSLTALSRNHLFSLYSQNMAEAPHGAMHNYIGYGNDTTGKLVQNQIWQKKTYGVMADVPTAGFDPVFWLHHANIDRLWQQWTNSKNGKKVLWGEIKSVPWPYVFFDENGKKVSYPLEEVFRIIYKMDYDNTKMSGKEAFETAKKVKETPVDDSIAGIEKVFLLNKTQTKISLPNAKVKTFDLLSKSKPAGKVLILSISVSFHRAPKSDYEVYFNVPENEAKNPESKYFVGSMTFFGADHKHGTQSGHDHMKNYERIKKLFRFEVNGAADASIAMEKIGFDVTVIKFGGNSKDNIQIDNISLITR